MIWTHAVSIFLYNTFIIFYCLIISAMLCDTIWTVFCTSIPRVGPPWSRAFTVLPSLSVSPHPPPLKSLHPSLRPSGGEVMSLFSALSLSNWGCSRVSEIICDHSSEEIKKRSLPSVMCPVELTARLTWKTAICRHSARGQSRCPWCWFWFSDWKITDKDAYLYVYV